VIAKDEPAQKWAIRARGLTKSFGQHDALNGVDLEIGYGESVVIFGPNGAGKTTLIKILATIMKPSAGTLTIDGLELKNDAEEIRRRIGLLSHQTFLYNNLTAYENLDFNCRIYDIPRARERIQEVVDMLGMTSRLHDRVGTFSRGMRQRVSIARALLHKPAIMLLDEPETGLDQQGIAMLWQALKAEGKVKRTIIQTTHSLERGLELCERCLILARGKIVYQRSTKAFDLADLKQVYREATATTP